jgi:hypothetical protein
VKTEKAINARYIDCFVSNIGRKRLKSMGLSPSVLSKKEIRD